MVETENIYEINKFCEKRLLSIDVFKGVTILLMVFVNIIAKYHAIPEWSKHGIGYTITYVDLVLPLFLFMMTLNFRNSYETRLQRDGKKKVYVHFIRRYLIFIGVGFLFSIDFRPPFLRWGALQVLGLSGIFLLPTFEFKPKVRFIFATGLIIFHQFIIIPLFSRSMQNLWAGGLYSCLAWGAMMLYASLIAEGLTNKKVKDYFLFGGLICVAFSFSTLVLWGISMTFTTIPYVFFCLGFCSLCYFGFYTLIDDWGKKKNLFQKDNFLNILGKNAFILYILHILLRLLTSTLLPSNTSIIEIFSAVFINIIVILGIAYILNKRQKFLKI